MITCYVSAAYPGPGHGINFGSQLIMVKTIFVLCAPHINLSRTLEITVYTNRTHLAMASNNGSLKKVLTIQINRRLKQCDMEYCFSGL